MFYNPGWIGSSFSEVSIVFRIGLLIGFYSAVLMLLTFFWKNISQSSAYFRYPVYFLFSGITGNFIDKIRLGAVIDFIEIKLPSQSIHFNMADFYQWIAVLYMLVAAIFVKDYFGSSRRQNIFTNKMLQLKLYCKISLIFVTMLFSINFLFLTSLQSLSLHTDDFISQMVWVSLCYGFLFETILLLVILTETQRWIGPIQSFILYMQNKDYSREFKLRKNDLFKELESIAKEKN